MAFPFSSVHAWFRVLFQPGNVQSMAFEEFVFQLDNVFLGDCSGRAII